MGEDGRPSVTPESCEHPKSRPGLGSAADEVSDGEQEGASMVGPAAAGEKVRETACARARAKTLKWGIRV